MKINILYNFKGTYSESFPTCHLWQLKNNNSYLVEQVSFTFFYVLLPMILDLSYILYQLVLHNYAIQDLHEIVIIGQYSFPIIYFLKMEIYIYMYILCSTVRFGLEVKSIVINGQLLYSQSITTQFCVKNFFVLITLCTVFRIKALSLICMSKFIFV